MTPSERRALLFLAAVAILGAGVRVLGAWRDEAARPAGEQVALLAQRAAAESAAARGRGGRKAAARATPKEPTGSGKRKGQKVAPASPVDVDRAGVGELDQLPRIGPVLAARIVADRDSLGPFGSLEGLRRVRGIGPAMIALLAPHVTFSGTPRPSSAAPVRQSATPRPQRPGSGGRRGAAPSGSRPRGRRGLGALPALNPAPATPPAPPPATLPATWPHRHQPQQSASATC